MIKVNELRIKKWKQWSVPSPHHFYGVAMRVCPTAHDSSPRSFCIQIPFEQQPLWFKSINTCLWGFASEKLNLIKYFKNSQNAAGYWLPQWIRSTASLGINPKAKDAQLQKNDLKTQHMLYFWAGGLRMSKMTFPCVNPIQLGPSHFNFQLFTSSIQAKFLKISFTKVVA